MTKLCKLKVKVMGFCDGGSGCPSDCCLVVACFALTVFLTFLHLINFKAKYSLLLYTRLSDNELGWDRYSSFFTDM